MMQGAKADSNEAIRGIIKIQSRQQCMFTYNLPATGFPCQTLTRIKENMIMKKISLKYISICLSICLLTTALVPMAAFGSARERSVLFDAAVL